MFIMAGAFFFAGEIAFNTHSKFPGIDVFNFQATGSWALSHGLNPYTFRYPSVYPPGTPFYGPGVVDAHGMLTVGFPYLPLSLLMVLPAQLIGGDVRYAMVIAVGLSAILMAAARPGRIGPLAAVIFLLTPRAIYVLDLAWTEPLLVLTFFAHDVLRLPLAQGAALVLGIVFVHQAICGAGHPAASAASGWPGLLEGVSRYAGESRAGGCRHQSAIFRLESRGLFPLGGGISVPPAVPH